MTTLNRRTTEVILFQGDDLDPLEERRRVVESAAGIAGKLRRIGDADGVAEAAAEYDRFLEEALTRAVTVRLVALDRKRWRELVAAHPPRPDKRDEQGNVVEASPDYLGFNIDTISDELVAESVAPGQFDDVEKFLSPLSDADFSRLLSAAVRLNTSAGPDPKARLSSLLVPTSLETSTSPARLG